MPVRNSRIYSFIKIIMHEFSIAVSMVDIALEYAEKSNASKVNEIELEIGELSGVVYDAMEFAMESAIKGTLLEGAKINIVAPPGVGKCNSCNKEFRLVNIYDACPYCGAYNPKVINGKELRVKSLNID
jgi:hydrogenase nickel incorporation protein HypA/HybF